MVIRSLRDFTNFILESSSGLPLLMHQELSGVYLGFDPIGWLEKQTGLWSESFLWKQCKVSFAQHKYTKCSDEEGYRRISQAALNDIAFFLAESFFFSLVQLRLALLTGARAGLRRMRMNRRAGRGLFLEVCPVPSRTTQLQKRKQVLYTTKQQAHCRT